jgi:hypothetical protein
MYISSILMLLGWPVIILLCWFTIRIALNLYEKKQEKVNKPDEKEP